LSGGAPQEGPLGKRGTGGQDDVQEEIRNQFLSKRRRNLVGKGSRNAGKPYRENVFMLLIKGVRRKKAKGEGS